MAPAAASTTPWIAKIEHSLEESQNQRDARREKLWRKLDPEGKGELDLKGLQAAFRRIDHPMKNAGGMLRQIVEELDSNNDGKIQYSEFRDFLEHAEGQLLTLFRAIDHDKNGRLDRQELEQAFRVARLAVPARKLDDFFRRMDSNNDGFVSFEEWRDFLMFMPVAEDGSHLHAVMSWYSSIVTITAEGDSVVSDDKLSKTGRRIDLLMRSLFGAVLAIIIPRAGPAHVPTNKISPPSVDLASGGADRASLKAPPADDSLPPSTASPQLTLPAFSLASPPPQPPPSSAPLLSTSVSSVGPALAPSLSIAPPVQPPSTPSSITSLLSASGHPPVEVDQESDADAPNDEFSSHADHPRATKKAKAKGLTAFIPDPGYFLAGAAAGGVSRTATAPLDRLKVYLLVNTQASPGATAAAAASSAVRAGAADAAVAAAKQGRLLVAARASFNPILHAVQDIYGSGGLRNFFAGNGLNVVKIMPETAIKFGTYEAAKRALASIEGHGDTHAINTYSKFAAGGVAGMVAQFSVYPLDTLKFRLQCETVKGGPKGNELLMATARRMFAEGVWRTSYRGVTMGLVGMFPYSAIDMWTFDFLKGAYARQLASWTGRHEEDAKPGNLATGIIGATSGAFGATVVYPLNVVRTRLQTQGTVMHRATYTGIVDATRKTIQNEGVRGLYKGLTPNLLKVAPALSITWVVYENAKKALQLD